MITVTVKGGGLKMLQIQDNGTGIRKEDMAIVAERFTTSKLREFSDLANIATFGFRGEALASISHVAHLTILTNTRNSPCGYKCGYRDSVMESGPSPLAANQGTTITVEDLFYNIPNRRAALRSPTEEHNKVADVVTKYAIHNSGVAFALKKQGEAVVEVKTLSENSVVENIKTVYGPAVARELIELQLNDSKLKFECQGRISNVNYNVEKMIFLLFINNRLVDCSTLKKAIEEVYASYLPKGSSPFAYMSLKIAPQNLDVNVHPTKHEVFFLHQDAIIQKIQQGLEEKLLNSNASRTLYCKKLLPGAGATLEMLETDQEKSLAAKEMVRTDANAQKIEKFFNANKAATEAEAKKRAMLDPDLVNLSLKTDLTSVHEMKQEMLNSCSIQCKELLSNLTFVGCVDRELALIQHETQLYLVNSSQLSRLLFRQILFSKFSSLPVIRLCNPPRVLDLALLALDLEEVGWSPEDGEKADIAEQVCCRLEEQSAMLAEYFSLELETIEGQLHLTGLPLLLEDFCPWFGGLPLYILRLATEVEWDSEKECFQSFAEETAKLYSVGEVKGRSPRYDYGPHGGESREWSHSVEHILYPAIKKLLLPPASCMTDRTLVQVVNLPDLYKVFERC